VGSVWAGGEVRVGEHSWQLKLRARLVTIQITLTLVRAELNFEGGRGARFPGGLGVIFSKSDLIFPSQSNSIGFKNKSTGWLQDETTKSDLTRTRLEN